MGNSIYLYGASGHCKVIVDIISLNGLEVAAILDDRPDLPPIFGHQVIAPTNISADSNMIISIGNNATRKKLSHRHKLNYITAIHPTAILSEHVKLNAGTVVMAGAVINADTVIGEHCIVNTGAIIEHDCNIGDFVHISPGVSLAGNVTIGEGTHMGIGATVIQGIRIGKWVTIGAGAVIIKDIADNCVVVGNPGRIIKNNTNE
jgi:acetyltransferase EpsM